MGLLGKIFGSGGKTVLDGAGQLINAVDGLKVDAAEKAEIRKSVIQKVIEAQSKAVVAEATSESWLARSWRPICMLTLLGLVVCHYAVFPLVAAAFPAAAPVLAAMALPPDAWMLIQVGLGGYATARTGEKLAKTAMPLLTARQERKKLKLEAKLSGDPK